jgi:GABA(A) receptor-associated protein
MILCSEEKKTQSVDKIEKEEKIIEKVEEEKVEETPEEKITHKYQRKFSLEHRIKECKKIRTKYPDRIPVIVEKSVTNSGKIPNMDKHKFLVPADITIGQFMYVLRQRIKLRSKVGMFLFINNKMLSTSTLMGTIYNEEKNIDDFLYITFSGENTFGN